MNRDVFSSLKARSTPGASVSRAGEGRWRLEIPAGPAGRYRLAQLDDTTALARRQFRHSLPFTLSLQARASAAGLPGTWGFGLWNDPFSLSLGLGGGARRFPALPSAAWFFFASPQNYLSFRDDQPANGALAQVFASATPDALLALASPLAALLALPFCARICGRLIRRVLAGKFIREAATALTLNPMDWHRYEIIWQPDELVWRVDGGIVFSSPITPRPPLGLVLWVDNQYAAFPPDGSLRYGTLENPAPAWVELVL